MKTTEKVWDYKRTPEEKLDEKHRKIYLRIKMVLKEVLVISCLVSVTLYTLLENIILLSR